MEKSKMKVHLCMCNFYSCYYFVEIINLPNNTKLKYTKFDGVSRDIHNVTVHYNTCMYIYNIIIFYKHIFPVFFSNFA